MTYLYADSGVDSRPIATLATQQMNAALAKAGIAAVRYVESRNEHDYAQMRMAVMHVRMYDSIAREAQIAAVAL
jgi:hypothetical protein